MHLHILAVILTCALTAHAADPHSALQAALVKEDPAAIAAAVAQGLAFLGPKAGIPEVPDKHVRVPAEARLLSAQEAREAVPRTLAKLDQVRFWKVGLDPTRLSAPLRAPAGVVGGLVAMHRARLDPEGRLLRLAEESAEFLMWAQEQGGAGCFPFPAARNKSPDRAMQVAARFLEKAEAGGRLHEIVRNGWVHEDHGDGGLQFDNGECGVALLELYEITQDRRHLDSALKAADWAMARPLCANWNYNSFSVDLLAKAHEVTGRPAYLEAALKKARLGMVPGQLASGPNAGRWMDPHNARPAYHYIMMRALVRLAGCLPETHPDRPWVRRALGTGLAARNDEVLKSGVMTKDKLLECLVLAQRRLASDKDLLDATKCLQVLDKVHLLASEEARHGKLPLGPRAWGDLLARCAGP